MIKIAFFNTKHYDREVFDKYNQEYNPHYRLIHKDLYNKLFL